MRGSNRHISGLIYCKFDVVLLGAVTFKYVLYRVFVGESISKVALRPGR